MPKTPEEYFIDWEGWAFGYGYGTGEPHVVPALKAFLEACPDSGAYDHAAIEDRLGPTVAWLLVNALARTDAIEYGTSTRYAWLTEAGRTLRRFVQGKTADELVALVTEFDEGRVRCYPDACNCGPHGYEKGRVCRNPFWCK